MSPKASLVAAVSLFSSLLSIVELACAADTALADIVDPVVVTATRIEQPLSRIGDSITVIEPEAVRASQKTSVSDLLATTSGVTVSRNGGLGATTSLRIRGAESDHTVVLIDGVKLNDPSSPGGGYNFGNLLTNDVARIEVLRGPQSTLWGSQAIGGVVHVLTRPPQGPLSATVSAEAGSRESAAVDARVESGGERFAWRVGGQYVTTDGISAFDEDLGGREQDGYRNIGFNLRGIYTVSEAVSAEMRWSWWKGRLEFDGFPPPDFRFADTREYGDNEELVAYAGVNVAAFGGRLRNRIGFAYTDTDRENFNPDSTVRRTFDAFGRNERWEYQGTLDITDAASVVFGLESELSKLSTVSPSASNPNPMPLARDVRLHSGYVQLQWAPLAALTLTAGLRRDDHETFGGNTTGRAAIAWSVTPSTILRASHGEGFKAPTLFQLFSEFGNGALLAEQAEGWDAGVEQRLFNDALVLSATYFSRDTRNMIDFVSCAGNEDANCAVPRSGYYDNVQKTIADGIEWGLAARLGERVTLTANYTTMDAENAVRSGANFGRALPRRASDTANAEISYHWPSGLSTTVAVQHVGRSYDNASNSAVLDDYTLVDLRASYALGETLEVYGRVENAFAEDYQTVRRYGSIGRGGFMGIRRTF